MRLAGIFMKKEEKQAFEKVLELVMEERYEEAEEAGKGFPFGPEFVQLKNADGRDDDEYE